MPLFSVSWLISTPKAIQTFIQITQLSSLFSLSNTKPTKILTQFLRIENPHPKLNKTIENPPTKIGQKNKTIVEHKDLNFANKLCDPRLLETHKLKLKTHNQNWTKLLETRD